MAPVAGMGGAAGMVFAAGIDPPGTGMADPGGGGGVFRFFGGVPSMWEVASCCGFVEGWVVVVMFNPSFSFVIRVAPGW
ncbi:hypothetical protein GCM10027580_16520 [Corynebacterium faecale]